MIRKSMFVCFKARNVNQVRNVTWTYSLKYSKTSRTNKQKEGWVWNECLFKAYLLQDYNNGNCDVARLMMFCKHKVTLMQDVYIFLTPYY